MPWRPGVLPFCPSWPPSAQRPMLRVASGVSRAAAGLGNSKPIPGAAAAAECLTPIRQNKTPCSPFLNDPLFAFSPPLCASKSLDTSSPPPRDLIHNSSVSTHCLHQMHRQGRTASAGSRTWIVRRVLVSAHGRLERRRSPPSSSLSRRIVLEFSLPAIPITMGAHIARVLLSMFDAIPPSLSSSIAGSQVSC